MQPCDMYRICTDELRDFVTGAGFADVVIGLSGGIDSSVVAVMAVDALGAGHVHGVLLPAPTPASTRSSTPRSWRATCA